MSKPQKFISAFTSTKDSPIWPKKAQNDPNITQNQKVRKQKIFQNEIYKLHE